MRTHFFDSPPLSWSSCVLLSLILLVGTSCAGKDASNSSPPLATSLSLSKSPVALDVGDTTTITASVYDQNGKAMSSAGVSWSITGNAASIMPAGLSVRVVGLQIGRATLSAAVGSLTSSADIIVAQLPSAINDVSGNQQTGYISTALSQPIRVRVIDKHGNGVPSQQVMFSVQAGSGSVSPQLGLTEQDGIASATWTLGSHTGPQSLVASGLNGSITFSATAIDRSAAGTWILASAPAQRPFHYCTEAPATVFSDVLRLQPGGGYSRSMSYIPAGDTHASSFTESGTNTWVQFNARVSLPLLLQNMTGTIRDDHTMSISVCGTALDYTEPSSAPGTGILGTWLLVSISNAQLPAASHLCPQASPNLVYDSLTITPAFTFDHSYGCGMTSPNNRASELRMPWSDAGHSAALLSMYIGNVHADIAAFTEANGQLVLAYPYNERFVYRRLQ